jgi:flavodoxin
MNSLVIFGSRYGNTRRIAEAITAELGKHGKAQMASADEAPPVISEQFDLVVVGGPTEAHRMSVPLTQFFDRIPDGALAGSAAAAFDTRVRWPVLLSGSAAAGIARQLERRGATVVGPPASFFVGRKVTILEPGELEQAAAWAASLASRTDARRPVMSAR